MESNLKRSIERAKKYLQIIKKFSDTGKLARLDSDWLYAHSSLLQEEVERPSLFSSPHLVPIFQFQAMVSFSR